MTTHRDDGGPAPAEADASFRWVISRLPVPMAVCGAGQVLLVNDALADLLEAPPSAIEGRPATAFLRIGGQGGEQPAPTGPDGGSAASEPSETETMLALTATGAEVHVEVSPMPFTFEGRSSVLLAVRDVTERKRAEDALRASEARWRALVQHGGDLIIVLDADARLTYISPSARTILAQDSDDLVGSSALDLIHPEDVEAAAETLRLRVSGPNRPHSGLRVRARTGDGRWRWLDTFATNLLDDPDVRGVIINAWDVTRQVAAERHLRHLAQHDSLTGLPNRALLADRLSTALDEGRVSGSVTGLLMLDLDRFKDVNDTLGHESGDRVLATLAVRLAAAVREDDVVGRIGGDEFAVVLPDAVDAATVERVARRLLDACIEPVLHQGMQLRVGASIGMVLAPDHGDEPSLLLRRVDAAMYRAKAHRLGVVAATEGDLEEGRRRLTVAEELRVALERGDLRCAYQPKVDLGTGRVVGVEALLRWQHPQRGLIGPDQFLVAAEQLGLMAPITRWVLREALLRLVAWVAEGLDVTVAVNLCATMLHDPQLSGMVDELLAESGADPDRLVLEVTEQAAMVQPDVSLAAMAALRSRGIRFSIDDFGTGQSSLTYLRRLPVAEVKIDRSFITDINPGTPDAAIARSVVDLAHNLGMRAVAEGIESAEALGLVRSFACDLGQGWHLGRPMAAELVPAVCRARLRT